MHADVKAVIHACGYVLTAAGCLAYQVDIEDFPDIKSGFKISFKFEEGNPFFTNTQLDKQLHFADDASLEVKCSTIDWKEEAVSRDSPFWIRKL